MMDFAGQHVVITGASTGIGRAAAERVVRAGARVTLIARRGELLADLCAELGAGAGWAAADVGQQDQLIAALDSAAAQHGPIDALFLNAGTGGTFALLEDYSDDNFDALMAVNMKSAFWAVRHVLPAMKARQSGTILITGSLASERGMAMNVGYVMSKHAVLGLARAAALEGAAHGVRVNCLVPGFIATPLLEGVPPEQLTSLAANVPQQRLGTSEDVAEVAAFLLSRSAAHVTGQSWAVDGGVLGTLAIR
ncbi:SDR family NAD(P)-dependent oxidoreductase [Novosphingobium sp. PASSN1]|uniref:SDR family NAD(P)-dependent oxidoreductase n=1 Tax=Novosphingobium sp. PASSN1 TaxID=2015561 RepID=UPI000BD1B394|nr:SDR family NAD(P)-dependent oxidoreductase [Novosphingobium sp. PASSN1]OYU34953.1 MAG: short-chain dehydrogenase [Novosphingobium sp. PASSN1]